MLSQELVNDRADLVAEVASQCNDKGLDAAVVGRLIADAPSSWWTQADAATLAGDLALLGPGIGAEGVRIRITPATGATWELAIVTADRIGAFAATCSTLSDFGLSVLEARAASWTGHGLALQHLRAEPVELPLSGEPDWPTIGLGLRAALTQEVLTTRSLNTLHDSCEVALLVNHETPESCPDTWTLVVTGPDTVGLLASITRMLTALGADILSAEVTSVDGVAHDAFMLRLSDPAGVAALRALAR
jgi:UTP:GlnB (protein PII) uridylyltransferase